jgi:CHAT domain-containing protein
VLLRYHDTDLADRSDLKLLSESSDPDQRVRMTVWRQGKTFTAQARLGELGARLADEPAPVALAAQHKLDSLLASARGGGEKWPRLPGTRLEVEALRRLFVKGGAAPKLLLGSQASEQELDELARSSGLGRYRYLHLATHGVMDDRWPLRSAVILARDALPNPLAQLQAGRPVYDGRLTADKVLRQWHLDSELVTLSACQTALGKYERGEGHVGFAQALLLAGSRSVCLSLWNVDDTATALLMGRFYANLLGQVEGQKAPLGKAEALREAQHWLRNLSRAEAEKQAAALAAGVPRGEVVKLSRPVVPAPRAGERDTRPYAHPYYWAAFILLGDPE